MDKTRNSLGQTGQHLYDLLQKEGYSLEDIDGSAAKSLSGDLGQTPSVPTKDGKLQDSEVYAFVFNKFTHASDKGKKFSSEQKSRFAEYFKSLGLKEVQFLEKEGQFSQELRDKIKKGLLELDPSKKYSILFHAKKVTDALKVKPDDPKFAAAFAAAFVERLYNYTAIVLLTLPEQHEVVLKYFETVDAKTRSQLRPPFLAEFKKRLSKFNTVPKILAQFAKVKGLVLEEKVQTLSSEDSEKAELQRQAEKFSQIAAELDGRNSKVRPEGMEAAQKVQPLVAEFFKAIDLNNLEQGDSTWIAVKNFARSRALDFGTDEEAVVAILEKIKSPEEMKAFQEAVEASHMASGRKFEEILADETSGRLLGRLQEMVRAAYRGDDYYFSQAYQLKGGNAQQMGDLFQIVKQLERSSSQAPSTGSGQAPLTKAEEQTIKKVKAAAKYLHKLALERLSNKDSREVLHLTPEEMAKASPLALAALKSAMNVEWAYKGYREEAKAMRQVEEENLPMQLLIDKQERGYVETAYQKYFEARTSYAAKVKANQVGLSDIETLNQAMVNLLRQIDIFRNQEEGARDSLVTRFEVAEQATYTALGASIAIATGGAASGIIASILLGTAGGTAAQMAGMIYGDSKKGKKLIRDEMVKKGEGEVVQETKIDTDRLTEIFKESGKNAFASALGLGIGKAIGAAGQLATLGKDGLQTAYQAGQITQNAYRVGNLARSFGLQNQILRTVLVNESIGLANAVIHQDSNFGMDDVALNGIFGMVSGMTGGLLHNHAILDKIRDMAQETAENLAQEQFGLEGKGISAETVIQSVGGAFSELGGIHGLRGEHQKTNVEHHEHGLSSTTEHGNVSGDAKQVASVAVATTPSGISPSQYVQGQAILHALELGQKFLGIDVNEPGKPRLAEHHEKFMELGEVSAFTEVGLDKGYIENSTTHGTNEDAYGFGTDAQGRVVIVVADGMGGLGSGDKASAKGVHAIMEAVNGPQEISLGEAFLKGHDAIAVDGHGGGTVASAVRINLDGTVEAALAGDVRLLISRAKGSGEFEIIEPYPPNTAANDYRRYGMLADDTLHVNASPLAHRVNASLGILTDRPTIVSNYQKWGGELLNTILTLPDSNAGEPFHLQPGDALMLMTDGPGDMFNRAQIAETLQGRDTARGKLEAFWIETKRRLELHKEFVEPLKQAQADTRTQIPDGRYIDRKGNIWASETPVDGEKLLAHVGPDNLGVAIFQYDPSVQATQAPSTDQAATDPTLPDAEAKTIPDIPAKALAGKSLLDDADFQDHPPTEETETRAPTTNEDSTESSELTGANETIVPLTKVKKRGVEPPPLQPSSEPPGGDQDSFLRADDLVVNVKPVQVTPEADKADKRQGLPPLPPANEVELIESARQEISQDSKLQLAELQTPEKIEEKVRYLEQKALACEDAERAAKDPQEKETWFYKKLVYNAEAVAREVLQNTSTEEHKSLAEEFRKREEYAKKIGNLKEALRMQVRAEVFERAVEEDGMDFTEFEIIVDENSSESPIDTAGQDSEVPESSPSKSKLMQGLGSPAALPPSVAETRPQMLKKTPSKPPLADLFEEARASEAAKKVSATPKETKPAEPKPATPVTEESPTAPKKPAESDTRLTAQEEAEFVRAMMEGIDKKSIKSLQVEAAKYRNEEITAVKQGDAEQALRYKLAAEAMERVIQDREEVLLNLDHTTFTGKTPKPSSPASIAADTKPVRTSGMFADLLAETNRTQGTAEVRENKAEDSEIITSLQSKIDTDKIPPESRRNSTGRISKAPENPEMTLQQKPPVNEVPAARTEETRVPEPSQKDPSEMEELEFAEEGDIELLNPDVQETVTPEIILPKDRDRSITPTDKIQRPKRPSITPKETPRIPARPDFEDRGMIPPVSSNGTVQKPAGAIMMVQGGREFPLMFEQGDRLYIGSQAGTSQLVISDKKIAAHVEIYVEQGSGKIFLQELSFSSQLPGDGLIRTRQGEGKWLPILPAEGPIVLEEGVQVKMGDAVIEWRNAKQSISKDIHLQPELEIKRWLEGLAEKRQQEAVANKSKQLEEERTANSQTTPPPASPPPLPTRQTVTRVGQVSDEKVWTDFKRNYFDGLLDWLEEGVLPSFKGTEFASFQQVGKSPRADYAHRILTMIGWVRDKTGKNHFGGRIKALKESIGQARNPGEKTKYQTELKEIYDYLGDVPMAYRELTLLQEADMVPKVKELEEQIERAKTPEEKEKLQKELNEIPLSYHKLPQEADSFLDALSSLKQRIQELGPKLRKSFNPYIEAGRQELTEGEVKQIHEQYEQAIRDLEKTLNDLKQNSVSATNQDSGMTKNLTNFVLATLPLGLGLTSFLQGCASANAEAGLGSTLVLGVLAVMGIGTYRALKPTTEGNLSLSSMPGVSSLNSASASQGTVGVSHGPDSYEPARKPEFLKWIGMETPTPSSLRKRPPIERNDTVVDPVDFEDETEVTAVDEKTVVGPLVFSRERHVETQVVRQREKPSTSFRGILPAMKFSQASGPVFFKMPIHQDAVILGFEGSSRHTQISRAAGDNSVYLIQDLGSKGGTFINGYRLPAQTTFTLSPGDFVQLGQGGPWFQFEVQAS